MIPHPANPRLSPLAAARDAGRRFEERSSFECVRGILEAALEKCEIQLKDLDDLEILNDLQELKARAALKAME